MLTNNQRIDFERTAIYYQDLANDAYALARLNFEIGKYNHAKYYQRQATKYFDYVTIYLSGLLK